ncbi:MAG TPA: thiamine pyrophosphate-dependent enzyme [Bryobacteraceae bacterium]|nr:thiamine pyrophosphate-dependent enzyme [Bryobacteraceae bacterium]
MAKLKGNLGRRGFLKSAAGGAAAGAAALAVPPQAILAQQEVAQQQGAPQQGGRNRGGATQPDAAVLAREDGTARPTATSRVVERPGSDHMVDVIKSLGIEYCAFNPGSSFEGLHESLINYGENKMPEVLTCLHEESSVAMAHGYAKIEGKPMLALLHGTIGVQHAAMAIYNAYGDRVPIVMIAGVGDTAVPAHTAVDLAVTVRDYVKWDHQPATINTFAQTLQRAYKLAMTPPMAPVLVVADAAHQQMRAPNLNVPKLVMPAVPSADLGSVREIAKMLVAAENPRINAGRAARTQKGMDLLVELAEALQAPVNGVGERINFPSRHPLAGNGAGNPDFVLNLEGGGGGGFGGAAGGGGARPKTVSITSAELLATHNFNVNGNAPQGDLVIAADAEASLPALIEETKKQITPDRKRAFEERGKKHAEANLKARRQAIEAASYGWDASPISLARIAAELWPLIEHEDWSFVSPQGFVGNWPNRLWNMDKTYRYIGGQGAGGMGYGAPASVGAALANRKYGRISVNIQTDGDMNYAPGVLWTAVHHKIPLLSIMHNNRGYHQEVMFVQQQCALRNRGADRAHIGTRLIEPNIDYAKMASAYGMYSEGPIADPKDLLPALKRGVERVKKGEPVMLDVITQPRG